MTASTLLTVQSTDSFKICTNCDARWTSMDVFIQDPAIQLVGYMPTFDDLVSGLFLFNHSCGTTLACRVGQFEHLYDGPMYRDNKTGGAECPGYCQNQTEFSPCPVKCNCAFVRDILNAIRQWPKLQAS